jgi:activator of HSP90 ATPase
MVRERELIIARLITIYDCNMMLEWAGVASDGTEVQGTLSIPEVSHEITLDRLSDYQVDIAFGCMPYSRFTDRSVFIQQYAWALTTATTPAVEALFNLAKSRLSTALETKFAEFPSALIDTHGKDLTVSADPSRSGTPAPPAPRASTPASTSTNTASSTKPSKDEGTKSSLNTTKISVEATFMAAADDLFGLFTDEKRIPSWTRAAAQV